MIDVKKYRKKPVVIEAVQYNYKDIFDDKYKDSSEDEYFEYQIAIDEWIGIENLVPTPLYEMRKQSDYTSKIKTIEGDNMTISDGDYIIKGVKGEFYPCKPDIFKETYELE